jgi:transcriptional regulator with XRE-family HTH domain
MPRVRALTPGASPMHFFGSEVRRARESVGMSQSELGELVPCDKSVVSRTEASLTPVDEAFAHACDVAFPNFNGFFTRFWRVCQSWGAALPAPFREFAHYEAEAMTIWTFQHALVPGILQTEDYARAVLERHPNVTDDQVSERVTARVARQAILESKRPPLLWALLDESVLYREVGGAKIMKEQMTRLAVMGRQPYITIQVIPRDGAHAGLMGSFDIAETPDTTMVHLEHMVDGLTTDSPYIAAQASQRFESLRADAYPRRESQTMIEEMAEKWNHSIAHRGASQPTPERTVVAALRQPIQLATSWSATQPTAGE